MEASTIPVAFPGRLLGHDPLEDKELNEAQIELIAAEVELREEAWQSFWRIGIRSGMSAAEATAYANKRMPR